MVKFFKRFEESKFIIFFSLVVATCILLFPAFSKGIFFIWYDTPDYCQLDFLNKWSFRAPGYSLFVWLTTLGRHISLWGAVVCQSFLVSLSIYRFFKFLLGIHAIIVTILVVIVASIFTEMAYYSSNIMSEVFATILVLEFSVILFAWNKLSKLNKVYTFSIFTLSVLSHYSYATILLIVLLMCLPFYKKLSLKPAAVAVVSILVCYLGTSFITLYSIQTKSWPFLFSRMLYSGQVLPALAELCQTEQLKLCDDQGILQEALKAEDFNYDSYLWEKINLEHHRRKFEPDYVQEYKKVIWHSIKRDPMQHIQVALNLMDKLVSAKGAFMTNICAHPDNDIKLNQIAKNYPKDATRLREVDSSYSPTSWCLPPSLYIIKPWIEFFQPYWLLCLIFIVIILVLVERKLNPMFIFLLVIFVSDLISSFVSGPFPRYHLKYNALNLIGIIWFFIVFEWKKRISKLKSSFS